MRIRSRARSVAWMPVAAVLLAGGPVPGAAQPTVPVQWDAAREHATRAELEELLERFRAQSRSTAHSSRARDEARRSAELVERRLGEGDFRVGDRIVLVVEGRPEMSDTLTVRPGPLVEIPRVGPVPLNGVLRSELRAAMQTHLERHLRNPVLHAEALIRLSILGAVERPGFYVVAAHIPLTDVIMLAGGPAGNADLTDVRIERGSVRMWEGEALERAIIQGRTVDHLDIRAGDRVVVPAGDARSNWQRVRGVTMVLGSVVSLVYGVSRLF